VCRDCHQQRSAVSRRRRRRRAVSRTNTTTTPSLATRPHARQQSDPGTLDAVSTAGCAVAYVSSRSNLANTCYLLTYYYFASAAVAVDSSHMTASSSASWSRFSLPSNVVNGHVSTMWFMVCRWPQSQEGDWARPHLCKLARHGP